MRVRVMGFRPHLDTKMKSYKVLPVYLVEDHNEVLPYIYRAIGSKHLPLNGTTLIHFDSHPDMLVPMEMDADDVFRKKTLFESLSIENWILPAVYAGHLRHVVWLKPPWCTQVDNKSLDIWVGKCPITGTIRTNCKENYFVSETLYLPEEKLLNKKPLRFTIVVVSPIGWETSDNHMKTDSSTDGMDKHLTSDMRPLSKEQTLTGRSLSDVFEKKIVNAKGEKKIDNAKEENSEEGSACVGSFHSQPEQSKENHEFKKSACDLVAHDLNSTQVSILDVGKVSTQQDEHSSKALAEPDGFEILESPIDLSLKSASTCEFVSVRKTTQVSENSVQNQVLGKDARDEPSVKRLKKTDQISDTNSSEDNHECCLLENSSILSQETKLCLSDLLRCLDSTNYILDIDLDFFSTMNPFKQMFSLSQYQALQDLYRFDTPADSSDQALEVCLLKRTRQLASLKEVFCRLSEDGSAPIEHPRKDMIEWLVEDLKKSSMVPVDFALVHEAGCTCDDTELPHHVSTGRQVELLVDAVQDVLSHLPKPTIITVARSSSDDYCPANQVDFIQEKVLDMLQELYLEIDVTMDYGTDDG